MQRPHPLQYLTLLIPALLILVGTSPLRALGTPPGGPHDEAGEMVGDTVHGWNSPRALALVERARERRATPWGDADRGTDLRDYQAKASGHVYFFLDRTDSEERSLVRADQIALEIFWAAPNRTKQRIVGMRDESRLPNQMHYHLDHLTVVQDEFGDLIRLGDGDEVREVPHPAAPGSGDIYDFRLADSTVIRLAGSPTPILVHELEVRPRRPDEPAFIGSIFLDQATAAIVRMNFTFTPASYVDDRLDYIQVGLDNGLWEGRYWLPNEQTLEIRRQVPILDFPAGSIIQGRFRIGEYEFDQGLPDALFHGSRIVASPKVSRERYEFPEGIYAGLDPELLELAPIDIGSLRKQATKMLGRQYLSGLPRLRLYLPNSSSVLRYNRSEAFHLGAGLSYSPGPTNRLRLVGGYATGPSHLTLGTEWRLEFGGDLDLSLRAERNALQDIGIRPGLPGAFNTIAAAGFGKDYLDPFYTTGADLAIGARVAQDWRAEVAIGYGAHRNALLEETSALFNAGATFRPVRPIDEGDLATINLRVARSSDRGPRWSGMIDIEGGHFDGGLYLRPTIEIGFIGENSGKEADLIFRGTAGLLTSGGPLQRSFLLGGPGTLPGYGYRSFGGDRFALVDLVTTHDLIAPWARLRLLGAAGWTDFSSIEPPSGWDAGGTSGVRASLGLGLGLFYDILRIDLVRGLRHGQWEWVFSVSPAIADLL